MTRSRSSKKWQLSLPHRGPDVRRNTSEIGPTEVLEAGSEGKPSREKNTCSRILFSETIFNFNFWCFLISKKTIQFCRSQPCLFGVPTSTTCHHKVRVRSRSPLDKAGETPQSVKMEDVPSKSSYLLGNIMTNDDLMLILWSKMD